MTTAPNHRQKADEHAEKAENLINDDMFGVIDDDAGKKAITHALLAIFHDQRARHIDTEED